MTFNRAVRQYMITDKDRRPLGTAQLSALDAGDWLLIQVMDTTPDAETALEEEVTRLEACGLYPSLALVLARGDFRYVVWTRDLVSATITFQRKGIPEGHWEVLAHWLEIPQFVINQIDGITVIPSGYMHSEYAYALVDMPSKDNYLIRRAKYWLNNHGYNYSRTTRYYQGPILIQPGPK